MNIAGEVAVTMYITTVNVLYFIVLYLLVCRLPDGGCWLPKHVGKSKKWTAVCADVTSFQDTNIRGAVVAPGLQVRACAIVLFKIVENYKLRIWVGLRWHKFRCKFCEGRSKSSNHKENQIALSLKKKDNEA